MTLKDKALDFLKTHQPNLCVLSTASKSGISESAVMAYTVKVDGTCVLSTHAGTRKIRNMRENPQISLVCGWAINELTLQANGNASLIENGPEYAETKAFFYSLNPQAAKFFTPDTVFINVDFTWIRVTDLSITPPHVEEINLTIK